MRTLISGIILFLIGVGCDNRSFSEKLTIQLDSPVKSLFISSISSNIHQTFRQASTIDTTFRNQKDHPVVVTLSINYDTSEYILIPPKTDWQVQTKNNQFVITVPKLNKDFRRFEQLRQQQIERFPQYYLVTLPHPDFQSEFEQKYAPLVGIIDSLRKENANQWLLDVLQHRLEWQKAAELLYYPEDYRGNTLELSSDYYNFLSSINIDVEYMADFLEGYSFVWALLEKKIKEDDFSTRIAYKYHRLNFVKNMFTNPTLNAFFTYDALKNIMYLEHSTDPIEDELQRIERQIDHKQLRFEIKILRERWSHAKKGAQFTDFQLYDPQGEYRQLSEFYGKPLYIDIWASWCGPCLAELPFLANLQKKIGEDKLQIIQISVDGERDDWRDFINKNEMIGIQLWTVYGLELEIAKKYQIKKIPRFILLDENGKIIDINAPAPSDKRLELLLSDIL